MLGDFIINLRDRKETRHNKSLTFKDKIPNDSNTPTIREFTKNQFFAEKSLQWYGNIATSLVSARIAIYKS